MKGERNWSFSDDKIKYKDTYKNNDQYLQKNKY